MKKIIKNVLHHWYIYLLVIAASTFAMVYLCNMIYQPRNEETISLFVSPCDYETSKLRNKLEDNKPYYLREIQIYSISYFSENFDYYYYSYGKETTDVIILPESRCLVNVIESFYCSFKVEDISETIPDAEFFKDSKGNARGIKVRSKENHTNNILKFEDDSHNEDYYAFFSVKSLHTGKIKGSNWNTALEFVNIIKNC